MGSVFITGADRNLGLAMCRAFLKRGWLVFGGQYAHDLPFISALATEYPDLFVPVPADVGSRQSLENAAAEVQKHTDTLDMIVHNAAHFGSNMGSTLNGLNVSRCNIPFDINVLGAIRLTQSFLPLMADGGKRLCFITSEAGCIAVAHRTHVWDYGMSKTALNMAVRLMFNKLEPLGYSFRLYHPGWVRFSNDGVTYGDGKLYPWESAECAVQQFIEDRDLEDRLVIVDHAGSVWSY